MVKVKICGITNVDDALAAVEAGAAAIGLNFYPPSPRYIGLEVAERIVRELPDHVCSVGVFVDTAREHVRRITERLGLDAVQFHGRESPEFCTGWDTKVIKAIRARDQASLAAMTAYQTDFLLVDTYVEGLRGGTGKTVPWAWLTRVPTARLILAGGLTPDNVATAVGTVRPFAVDVASGVERAPGIKDVQKMKRFVTNAQRT